MWQCRCLDAALRRHTARHGHTLAIRVPVAQCHYICDELSKNVGWEVGREGFSTETYAPLPPGMLGISFSNLRSWVPFERMGFLASICAWRRVQRGTELLTVGMRGQSGTFRPPAAELIDGLPANADRGREPMAPLPVRHRVNGGTAGIVPGASPRHQRPIIRYENRRIREKPGRTLAQPSERVASRTRLSARPLGVPTAARNRHTDIR